MKKKLYSVFTAILIALLVVSPAGAGGFKISSAFSLGSLLANITATGLGNTNYHTEMAASGIGSVICTNNGGNQAPGQSSPHIDGRDSQEIPSTEITKNGKYVFSLEAVPPEEAPDYVLTWEQAGCPNSNWTGKIDFVYWQSAEIKFTDLTTNTTTTYTYSCVTTRTGPNSTPSTFDDGTVSCTRTN